MSLVAFFGPSMEPTLRESEMVEVVPYGDAVPREGDVVLFRQEGVPVIHRVTRVTEKGIATRGDNNDLEDARLLDPSEVQGRVAAAWRGNRRRSIAGGTRGRVRGRALRLLRAVDRPVARLFGPLYSSLSRGGALARLLPPSLRPRVAAFGAGGRERLVLLWGKAVIGRYDDPAGRWVIRRPFRLFADPRGRSFLLPLRDGSIWSVAGSDAYARGLAGRMAEAMGMESGPEAGPKGGEARLLLVSGEPGPAPADPGICVLPFKGVPEELFFSLRHASLAIARGAQSRGGVLVHGALAERDGRGVLLAAPSGTGKSTASRRFPAPWRSLSDDGTLVVRDAVGAWWAHPWPTWSAFLEGGAGGSWRVAEAVPLKGIFFLSQSDADRAEPLGPGHAASMLVECAQQISLLMRAGLGEERGRALALERFDNICALARAVPAHSLRLSLTGRFWEEISRVLDEADAG